MTHALEGEASELGYLGGHRRITDLVTGIVQMGARPYEPGLGAFLSQDPVLGHATDPGTLDPHTYVLDDPLGRFDLDGRDVCAPTPFGSLCAGEAAEEAGSAIGGAAEGVAGVVKDTWERELGTDERNAEVATGAAAGVATVATRTCTAAFTNSWARAPAKDRRASRPPPGPERGLHLQTVALSCRLPSASGHGGSRRGNRLVTQWSPWGWSVRSDSMSAPST